MPYNVTIRRRNGKGPIVAKLPTSYKTQAAAKRAGQNIADEYEIPKGCAVCVDKAKAKRKKKSVPKRRNTHLAVGQHAKFSKKHLDWVRDHGRSMALVHRAEGQRFIIDAVHPTSYNVTDLDTGQHLSLGDFQLVAASSRTRKFPGTGYRGKTPKKKNSRKRNPTVPDVWGMPTRAGMYAAVKPGHYEELPLPSHKGRELHYEAKSPMGGVASLTVRKTGRTSYYLFGVGGPSRRVKSAAKARYLIQRFLAEGKLPPAQRKNQIGTGGLGQGGWWGSGTATALRSPGQRGRGEFRYLASEEDWAEKRAQERLEALRVKMASRQGTRRNASQDRWIQEARKEMEEDGTVGIFTRQAKRHGLSVDTFAKLVKRDYEAWVRSGHEGRRPFSLTTYRRAMFYLNTR